MCFFFFFHLYLWGIFIPKLTGGFSILKTEFHRLLAGVFLIGSCQSFLLFFPCYCVLSSGSWDSLDLYFCLSGCDTHVCGFLVSLLLEFLRLLLYIDLYSQPMKSYLVEESCCCRSYLFQYFLTFIFSPLLLVSNSVNSSLVFPACHESLVHFLFSLPSISDRIFSVTLASRSFSFAASNAFVTSLGKIFPSSCWDFQF